MSFSIFANALFTLTESLTSARTLLTASLEENVQSSPWNSTATKALLQCCQVCLRITAYTICNILAMQVLSIHMSNLPKTQEYVCSTIAKEKPKELNASPWKQHTIQHQIK
eukprot:TRINITY_DN83471_c0_g1_i1.p1 TRINITY_DN83471_c0_g1~~TRINITY_DN83471_c0_g1_i1.p1  ORF type:complete len:111 (-),score=21.36 TRINITY_DN83471_c0_g1_i1:22-354(-)